MKLPSTSSAIFAVALGASLTWLGATVLGKHPDGAILGFSGTLWAVWFTAEREARRDQRRANGGPSPPSPPTPPVVGYGEVERDNPRPGDDGGDDEWIEWTDGTE